MGTVSVVYVGPDAYGVEIADSGQFAHTGQPLAVDSDLAERLLEQDTFVRSGTKAAKEAASRATPEEPEAPDENTPESEER